MLDDTTVAVDRSRRLAGELRVHRSEPERSRDERRKDDALDLIARSAEQFVLPYPDGHPVRDFCRMIRRVALDGKGGDRA